MKPNMVFDCDIKKDEKFTIDKTDKMYKWDKEALQKTRSKPKYRSNAKRVIRINKINERNRVTPYTSINEARLLNKVGYKKLKKSIEEGTELNGYFYDYQ